MRNFILAGVLIGTMAVAWIVWRDRSPAPVATGASTLEGAAPIIVKEPVDFSKRTFDPANPPSDMPPLSPGESAECVSDFLSNATVSGKTWRTDATHGTVTVTQIKVTLQLNVTIWTPADVSAHVMEHEEGHRQISEHYYQTADQLAAQIAAGYIGKQVEITGADLNAESMNALRQMGAEITSEYDKELNPNPTQLLYDSITDHSRNDVAVQEAVDHALKNVSVESAPASGDPPASADPPQNR